MRTIRERIEQCLARGWSTLYICDRLNVTAGMVEGVRSDNERINAMPDRLPKEAKS